MLFLLSLLALLARTGAIDKYIKRKKLEKERIERERKRDERLLKWLETQHRWYLKRKEKEAKRRAREAIIPKKFRLASPKPLTKKHIIDVFDNLNEREMNICRNNVRKAMTNPHWRYGRQFAEFKKMLNQILDKYITTNRLSPTNRKLLKVAEKLFIPESGWTKYAPLRSSWLIVAKYNKPKKQLVVKMVRGKQAYHFYRVPPWAYIALIVKIGNVGTYWWNKWYWRWSSNPQWKGVKKEWTSNN